MNGDDHFGDGAHPDDIGTHAAQHAVLGAGLQVRAGDGDEDSLVSGDSQFERGLQRDCTEFAGVRLAHVRKSRAERVVVDASQRIVTHEIDVVVDNDDVGQTEVRIHSASRVGHDERVGSEGLYHAHRKRDLLHRVAFIEMEAAFHRDDGHAAQLAADQLSRVRRRCGFRKVRNLAVGNHDLVRDLFGKSAKPGAEDQPGFWSSRPA